MIANYRKRCTSIVKHTTRNIFSGNQSKKLPLFSLLASKTIVQHGFAQLKLKKNSIRSFSSLLVPTVCLKIFNIFCTTWISLESPFNHYYYDTSQCFLNSPFSLIIYVCILSPRITICTTDKYFKTDARTIRVEMS